MRHSLVTLLRAMPVIAVLGLGMAGAARAADPKVERVAMACSQAADCQTHAVHPSTANPVPRRSEAPRTAKVRTAPSAARTTVDYEHDLWRHQSSS